MRYYVGVRLLGEVLVWVGLFVVIVAAFVWDLSAWQFVGGLAAVAVFAALYDVLVLRPTRPTRRERWACGARRSRR